MNTDALPPALKASLGQLAERYTEFSESDEKTPESCEELGLLLLAALEQLENSEPKQ